MKNLLSFMLCLSMTTMAFGQVEIDSSQITTYATNFFNTYGNHPDVGIPQATLESHLYAQFPLGAPLSNTCLNPGDFYVTNTGGNNITVGWIPSASATSYNLTILPLNTGISQTVNLPHPTSSATFFSFSPGLYLLTIQSFCNATRSNRVSIIIIDKPVQSINLNNCTCTAFQVMVNKSSTEVGPTTPVTSQWLTPGNQEEVYYIDAYFNLGQSGGQSINWHSDYFMQAMMGPPSSPGPLNAVNVGSFCSNNIVLENALDGGQLLYCNYEENNISLPYQGFFTFSNQFVFTPGVTVTGSQPNPFWNITVKRCVPEETPEDPGGGSLTGGSFSNELTDDQSTIDAISLSATPNPAKDRTIISFAIPNEGPVNLGLYNEYGQLVKTMAQNRILPAGEHLQMMDWSGLPTGIYTCKLSSASEQLSIRLVHIE